MQDARTARCRQRTGSIGRTQPWPRWLSLLLAVLLVGGASVVAGAEERVTGELAVIAHPGAAPLARRELVEVYRGKRRVDDAGERIVPLNLPGDDDVRRAFSLALLGQLPEDLEAYWNERYFHGISPPYVVSSVEAMLRFVAVTPGAIGYVPRCAADDRVAVVALIEVATPLPACAPAR